MDNIAYLTKCFCCQNPALRWIYRYINAVPVICYYFSFTAKNLQAAIKLSYIYRQGKLGVC